MQIMRMKIPGVVKLMDTIYADGFLHLVMADAGFNLSIVTAVRAELGKRFGEDGILVYVGQILATLVRLHARGEWHNREGLTR
jgi:hypothetical protein